MFEQVIILCCYVYNLEKIIWKSGKQRNIIWKKRSKQTKKLMKIKENNLKEETDGLNK